MSILRRAFRVGSFLIHAIPRSWSWLVDLVSLRHQVITHGQIQQQLRVLRILAGLSAGFAVASLFFAIRVWPTAKSRAVGILLDRYCLQLQGAKLAYSLGEDQLRQEAIRFGSNENLPAARRLARMNDLIAFQKIFQADGVATAEALKKAQASKSTLPPRLWGSTTWADPISGLSLPVSATQEDVSALVQAKTLRSSQVMNFIQALAIYSRPGAPELPSLETYIE